MAEFSPFNTTDDWKQKGYFLRSPPLTLIAYDPAGDGDDRDAVVVVSREEHQHGERWDPDFAVITFYRVLMAYRMPQTMEFPDKLAMLLSTHSRAMQWKYSGRSCGHAFCIETNGVGYAVPASLRQKVGNSCMIVPYVTVSRLTEDRVLEKKTAMPRLAALDHMRVLSEMHLLKVAKDAPGAKDLTREMGSFVWARPGRPEAIKGQNDDLVMAFCGALWIGAKVIPPVLKAQKFRAVSGRRH
jgi:hypothetical protein